MNVPEQAAIKGKSHFVARASCPCFMDIARAGCPCHVVPKSCTPLFLAIAFCVGFAATIAFAADVRVTLPLEGHYRAGRFMPVHILASGVDGGSLTLSAQGAVPVRIDADGGKVDATIPWLAVSDSLQSIGWSERGGEHPLSLPLLPLADHERLVGVAGDGAAIAGRLFPENSVIAVRLDSTQKLLAPLSAWESLDGVVLDSAAAATIDESQLRGLLAAGTAVAIRSDQRPAGNWPWARDGNAWVVRTDRVGPSGVIEPEVYLPTDGWLRGRPAPFRRHALLAAAAFAIVALAASMWRSRWSVVSVIGVSAATAFGWMIWEGSQSPVLQMNGRVLVRHDALMQVDRWTWYSTLRSAPATCIDVGLTKPIFESGRQIALRGAVLRWNPAAQSGVFEFHLEPRTALAFLSRAVDLSVAVETFQPARSPLTALAGSLYSRSGDQVLGRQNEGMDEAMVIVHASH